MSRVSFGQVLESSAQPWNGKNWRAAQRRHQDNLCAYCQLSLHGQRGTIEHIVPRCWGGPAAAPFNKLLVCAPCQGEKGHWENLVHRDHPTASGFVRCQALLLLAYQMALQPRKKAFGIRAVLFQNIPLHLERAMSNPGWAEVVSHRRELFFGGTQSCP